MRPALENVRNNVPIIASKPRRWFCCDLALNTSSFLCLGPCYMLAYVRVMNVFLTKKMKWRIFFFSFRPITLQKVINQWYRWIRDYMAISMCHLTGLESTRFYLIEDISQAAGKASYSIGSWLLRNDSNTTYVRYDIFPKTVAMPPFLAVLLLSLKTRLTCS